MIRTLLELQIRNLARGGGRDPDPELKAGYGSGINWRDTGINPSMSVPVCGNPDPDLEFKRGVWFWQKWKGIYEKCERKTEVNK